MAAIPFHAGCVSADDGSSNVRETFPDDSICDSPPLSSLIVHRAEQDPVGVSLDDVAAKLLRDKYLLTALELHTELVERNGRELPRLRDFFSNPGNFERPGESNRCEVSPGLPRTASIQTFDSLDFARYSDDGDRQVDERVAVLEFELRKAQETIKSLRANLTEAAESEITTPDSHFDHAFATDDDSIKPHERRALNFLVNEYLLWHNYKLTSITFADENEEQDFEDWDDVGLNIPKPPSLLHLYREYGSRHPFSKVFLVDQSVQAVMASVDRVTKDAATDPIDRYVVDDAFVEESPSMFVEHVGSARDSDIHVNVACSTPRKDLFAQRFSVCSECKRQLEVIVVPETPIPLQRFEDQVVKETVLNGDDIEEYLDDDCLEGEEDEEEEAIASPHTVDDSSSNDVAAAFNQCETRTDSSDGVAHFIDQIAPAPILSSTLRDASDNCCKRNVSPVFYDTLVDLCRIHKDPLNSRLAEEVSEVVDSGDKVVLTLARCLPYIVPNVILPKREELIPVILCTISLHPNAVERDRLLNILFNLIKRPDVDQRLTILNGFVAIAKRLGTTRIESELLPQCWEQINHKYVERRLLVAEACGVLIPFIPNEIRSSLIWSMLLQMVTDDKSDLVRESAIKGLSLLVASMEDADKYSQGLQLLVSAINDPSERVMNATLQLLLPSFASWSKDLSKLETDLVAALVAAIADHMSSLADLTAEANVNRKEPVSVINLLNALVHLLPWLFVSLLESVPAGHLDDFDSPGGRIDVLVGRFPPRLQPLCDVNVMPGGEARVAALILRYDEHIGAEWYETWPKYDWLVKTMYATDTVVSDLSFENSISVVQKDLLCWLPKMIELSFNVDLTLQGVIHTLAQFFHWMCRVFGRQFSASKIRPVFQEKLRISTDDMESQLGRNLAMSSIVPVYAAGVLTAFNQDEDRKLLQNFLHELIVMVSLCHLPLDGVQATIVELGSNALNHDLVLSVLWDVVVHTSALVRCTASRLFLPLIGTISDKLLSTRVAPALITLANDPEISVRISTVQTFGAILQSSVQKDLLDKSQMQLQTFLDDPLYKDQHSLHVEIIRTFGVIASNADVKFRDEFILPHLVALANHNNRRTNETKRIELALALFEAFSEISCCLLSKQLISELLLPGLKCLLIDVQQLLPQNEAVLVGMIHEFESKVDIVRPQHDRGGNVSGASNASSGIEDVRLRVSKMFSNRTPVKTNIQTIFQMRKK